MKPPYAQPGPTADRSPLESGGPPVWDRLQLIEGRERECLALAESLAIDGKTDQAIDKLTRLLSNNPQQAAARRLRGSLLRQAGRLADARADLELAVRIDPQSVEAPIALAGVYLQLGDYLAALRVGGRAVKIAPQRADAWRIVGDAQLALGNTRGAVKTLRRCLSLADEAGHWIALATVYRQQQLTTEALNAVRYAQQLRPPKYEEQLEVGKLLAELGQRAEAFAHYRGLVRRYPTRWEHLQLLAGLEAKEGQLPTCLTLLNMAVRLAPDNASLRSDLSEAYAACHRGELSDLVAQGSSAAEREAKDEP